MQEPDMNFCAALNEKSLLLQGLFKKKTYREKIHSDCGLV